MKKTFLLMLAGVMAFSMIACGGTDQLWNQHSGYHGAVESAAVCGIGFLIFHVGQISGTDELYLLYQSDKAEDIDGKGQQF